jgi:hypothetical protein
MRLVSKKLAVALLILLSGVSLAQGPGGQGRDMPIDAAMRNAVIEGVLKNLNEAYVFPDVAKKMEEAIRARAARKEYDNITTSTAFVRALTDHLQEVSKDKHLRVNFSADPIPERRGSGPSPADRERQRANMASLNFGFQKVERLDGNVGYLDLRGFFDAELAAETCAAAMTFLANTDALIIDLRSNGGGQPEMVALVTSYLFDKPTHLNDIYWRPTNKTTEFWTREKVAGTRYGMKDVFVLTSRRTFSGAEEFSYNLKNLKRATIIGETTGGGAHPVDFRRINEHFGVGVPAGRAINPITKTNWEGTGVAPDVDVPAAQALMTAQVMALKAVASKNTDPGRANRLKDLITSTQRELDEMKSGSAAQTGAGVGAAARETTQSVEQPGMPNLPDTPAGKTFAAFVTALNSGKIETMRKFHQDRAGNVENAEQDLDFYNQSGGLNVHSVVRSEPNEIEVLAQRKKEGNWVTFTMTVDANPPHPAMRIGMQPAAAPK